MAAPPPPKPSYGTLPPSPPPTTQPPPLAPPRRLVPGWVYLVIFVLLYSANNAVLALFMARGPPFTICGIMCVGNFLGCVSLYPVFFRQITWKNVRCVYILRGVVLRLSVCVCVSQSSADIKTRLTPWPGPLHRSDCYYRKVTSAQWGWMLLGCLLANVLGSAAYLQGLKLTR